MMSYLLKFNENFFICSLCIESDDTFIMLATNTREFYQEKISEEEIMERVNESESIVRLTKKKVLKLLKRKPDKFDISLRKQKLLHLHFEYEIKSHQKSLDTIKLNFNMDKITSPEIIGKYFVSGLLKTLLEQNVKDEERPNVITSIPCLSIDVNTFFDDTNCQDLYKMIGIETELKETSLDLKNIKKEKTNDSLSTENDKGLKVKPLKRTVDEKKFTYNNTTNSQDFEIKNLKQGISGSSKNDSNKSKSNANVKIPRKKANVKF